ncbi:MAG: GTP-binding protein, partial [Magnetospirillum sp.]|nr:GTP-binding protein [Magnetospirillum sp.]
KHRAVAVISCDNMRAGAMEQLAAFTRILDIGLLKARGPDSLRKIAAEARAAFDLVLIDSPGVNPFRSSDMDFLPALIAAAEVEPILVMAAGGAPAEAGEMAEAFAAIGTARLFATRLDTTRRLGSVLAAADAAQMAFSDVSASPHVASGIAPISALSMARLIIPQTAQQNSDEAIAS